MKHTHTNQLTKRFAILSILVTGLFLIGPGQATAQTDCVKRMDTSKTDAEKTSRANVDCWEKKAKSGEKNLREAILNQRNLSELDLKDADLTQAFLAGSNLSQTDLSGADLNGTDLSGTELTGANLSGANFGDASLTGAEMTAVKIKRADIPKLLQALGIQVVD